MPSCTFPRSGGRDSRPRAQPCLTRLPASFRCTDRRLDDLAVGPVQCGHRVHPHAEAVRHRSGQSGASLPDELPRHGLDQAPVLVVAHDAADARRVWLPGRGEPVQNAPADLVHDARAAQPLPLGLLLRRVLLPCGKSGRRPCLGPEGRCDSGSACAEASHVLSATRALAARWKPRAPNG